jgi:1-acyl-sn-glycerol-3-phosphate acyltransferase
MRHIPEYPPYAKSMEPTIPAALPRRGTALGRVAGRLVLRLLRWRIAGIFPDARKLVLIAAPHRSNWDFVVGLAGKTALSLDISWLGKHTLFRAPWGALFRWWGGIPVDRRSSNDTVAAVVDSFAHRERLVLAVAPEGTRAPGARWKTGFWHIAKGAGVPIVPIAFDWEHRVIRIMPAIVPRELESDMRDIQALYTTFHGRGA